MAQVCVLPTVSVSTLQEASTVNVMLGFRLMEAVVMVSVFVHQYLDVAAITTYFPKGHAQVSCHSQLSY